MGQLRDQQQKSLLSTNKGNPELLLWFQVSGVVWDDECAGNSYKSLKSGLLSVRSATVEAEHRLLITLFKIRGGMTDRENNEKSSGFTLSPH